MRIGKKWPKWQLWVSTKVETSSFSRRLRSVGRKIIQSSNKEWKKLPSLLLSLVSSKKWEHPEVEMTREIVQGNILVKGPGRIWRVFGSWMGLTNVRVEEILRWCDSQTPWVLPSVLKSMGNHRLIFNIIQIPFLVECDASAPRQRTTLSLLNASLNLKSLSPFSSGPEVTQMSCYKLIEASFL